MLDALKRIRTEIDSLIAQLEGKPETAQWVRKPLPANPNPAMLGCRSLWKAAETARRASEVGAPDFDSYDYVPGLQPGGVTRTPKYSAEQFQAKIVEIGLSPWGQKWLSDDRNAATIDADYQRHFLGYRVVRKNQNDEMQGYNRVP